MEGKIADREEDMTKREELVRKAREYSLRVGVYGPGDGVVRYRFEVDPEARAKAPAEVEYFAIDRAVFTAMGYKEAYNFVLHWGAGYEQGTIECLRGIV